MSSSNCASATRTRLPKLALLALLLLLSCQRNTGCGERPLAELTAARGEVSRDYRGREQSWSKADVGSAFAYGDALRTAKASLAEVRVGQRGRLTIESDTIVRFLDRVDSSAEPELKVTQGSATIEALSEELTLRTRMGTAVLQPGSKVLLTPASDADTYRVLLGGASFHQSDGQTIDVTAGHSLAIGIGRAVLDDTGAEGSATGAQATIASDASGSAPTKDAAATAEPSPDGPDATDPAANSGTALPNIAGSSAANERSPQIATRPPSDTASGGPADVAAEAGESFEVYDPKPPTRIGIGVPDTCGEGAELRLSGGRSVRASGVLALDLPVGLYRYNVYCLESKGRGRAEASGTIQVRKSDGTRALPRNAPHNNVELDGHSYRLIYQNLRPVVSVSWPSAPTAPGYTLALKSPNGSVKRWSSAEPNHMLDSAALRDGKHVLVMEAQDANKTRSRETIVNVAYDNSAPAATLELPEVAGFGASDPVEVRGIAAEGTSVSVDGQPLAVNPRGTFRHTLTLPPGRTALTVRFQHETHRVRYYVRRIRRTPP